MSNKTIEQKLNERHVKKTSKFVWRCLFKPAAKLFFHPNFTKITPEFGVDVKNIKGQFIFISNHASRLDVIFNGYFLKQPMNILVGYNEFYRSHLRPLFNLVGCIPKKNFTPDYKATKEMLSVVKQGGNLGIFVEGMNSISGAAQPVAVGTAALLKKLKLPVYYSVVKGGFLTQPKYSLLDRKGPVDVYFGQMFTPEDLEEKSVDELTDILNLKLYHDDYAWNKVKRYDYDAKGRIAEGLHNLLYWCPKCHKEFTMVGEGNTIKCTSCGNGATINSKYDMIPFDDSCIIPETQTRWFNMERERMKELVKDPEFTLEEHVKIGVLPEYKMLKDTSQTSIIVGEGMLHLDKTGLSFKGTKNNEDYSFHIDSKDLPSYGMCTDLSRFYTFIDGKFIEFYPDHECTEKWFMATEEIHRLNGGRWQDYKFNRDEIVKELYK